MPPRSVYPPRGSVYPQNDPATYRDLWLFEERLKSTAASLQERKVRYQLFLVQLLLVIASLSAEVLLPPESSLLAIPYRLLLRRLLPHLDTSEDVNVHPYVARGLLFVSVTMLVLFFASGMYSDKIAYANKYVPHANRALRSFNMYLNMRKLPLRTRFFPNPLTFFFPRPEELTPSTTSSRSSSPSPSLKTHVRSNSTSRPMTSIPPSSNPRGELLISSRVDKSFRESYDRYRSAFERKRQEKEWDERRKGWLGRLRFWHTPPMSPSSGQVTPAPSSSRLTSKERRGGMSRSGTPPTAPIAESRPLVRSRDRSPMGQGIKSRKSEE